MVHIYFKENNCYKVRCFFNAKFIFSDPAQGLNELILKYESENGIMNGDIDKKALLIPKEFYNKNDYTLLEQLLTDIEVAYIMEHQEIIEI